MTDVVVLVVAADDGVMPQTQEAIHHAQASGCPIVVALTKCDVAGSDPETAMAQLAEEGLELDFFGGNIPVRLFPHSNYETMLLLKEGELFHRVSISKLLLLTVESFFPRLRSPCILLIMKLI